MLQEIAKKMVERMLREGAIASDEREYCQYGMEITLANVVNLLIVVVVAILSGYYLGMAVFYIIFVGTRVYAGGYHTNNYYSCFLCFLVFNVASALLMKASSINNGAWMMILMLCFLGYGICLYRWAPIVHPCKPLTKEEQRRYRNISLGSYPILFLISIVLLETTVTCGKAAVCAIGAVTLLMILGQMRHREDSRATEEVKCSVEG